MMNRTDAIETALRRLVANRYADHAAMIHDLQFLGNMTHSQAVLAAKEVNRKYDAILRRRPIIAAR